MLNKIVTEQCRRGVQSILTICLFILNIIISRICYRLMFLNIGHSPPQHRWRVHWISISKKTWLFASKITRCTLHLCL
ncbi:hypothetical protein XELAEV_18009373mg [Xenopus laevis]|uniref:Uncharacterized protein n=1 Tax=Xenopus laevis TaxID=8355 RepID=A0A974DTE5_XENLA|nr:hypothetical protein XELAEV_18009373mg [Xenopus laevis]